MAFFACLFPLPPSQQKRAKMKRKGESHTTTVLLLLDLLAMLPACIPTGRGAGETPLSCSNIQHNTWETEETKETTREISIFKSATLWPILKTPTGGWYNAHPKRAFPSLQLILGAWGDMFSSEQLCFELGASMFSSNGSHEGSWNCDMHPTVMCQKVDRPWKDPKTSTALRMCLRWDGTKVSSLSCTKPGAAITTGALSVTPHGHNIHICTCCAQLHPSAGISNLNFSLHKNLTSTSSIRYF